MCTSGCVLLVDVCTSVCGVVDVRMLLGGRVCCVLSSV